MEITSEYTFPIFISSTDYNLKDLRAELARFLIELGYKPYLSSAEGFPDSSPSLEPWESCIPVLDKCFVVILIIDGRYGSKMNWPNYKTLFDDKEISPTHAEYIFSHKNSKRILVFIRKSLMAHYQSYRTVMKHCNYDTEKAKEILNPTLPEYLTFETLQFINEVKTIKPIPWINEFDDITCIKREVQKKMLNELAEMFLIKNKRLEIVVDAFNKVMDTLSPDRRKEVLESVKATKELVETNNELRRLETQLKSTIEKFEESERTGADNKKELEAQILNLEEEIKKLESKTQNSHYDPMFIQNGHLRMFNPMSNLGGLGNHYIYPQSASTYYQNQAGVLTFGALSRNCDECGTQVGNSQSGVSTVYNLLLNDLKTCSSCHKNLCKNCWSKSSNPNSYTQDLGFILKQGDKCYNCSSKSNQ